MEKKKGGRETAGLPSPNPSAHGVLGGVHVHSDSPASLPAPHDPVEHASFRTGALLSEHQPGKLVSTGPGVHYLGALQQYQ